MSALDNELRQISKPDLHASRDIRWNSGSLPSLNDKRGKKESNYALSAYYKFYNDAGLSDSQFSNADYRELAPNDVFTFNEGRDLSNLFDTGTANYLELDSQDSDEEIINNNSFSGNRKSSTLDSGHFNAEYLNTRTHVIENESTCFGENIVTLPGVLAQDSTAASTVDGRSAGSHSLAMIETDSGFKTELTSIKDIPVKGSSSRRMWQEKSRDLLAIGPDSLSEISQLVFCGKTEVVDSFQSTYHEVRLFASEFCSR